MGLDRGIRINGKHKFTELMPKRKALGDTAFRAAVINYIMEEFDCTLAGAATQYNEIKKWAQAQWPEELADLGRPADKNNGGRKKKVVLTPADDEESAALVEQALLALAGECAAVEAAQNTQATFTLYRKSDNSVVAEGLSEEEADKIIASGRVNGKFCKTYKK